MLNYLESFFFSLADFEVNMNILFILMDRTTSMVFLEYLVEYYTPKNTFLIRLEAPITASPA